MRKENIIGTNFIMTNRDLISKFGVNNIIKYKVGQVVLNTDILT